MQFSIIIPTYNRGKITLNTLKALQNQTVKEFQVVVVDQSDSILSDLQTFRTEAYIYRYLHIEMASLPNARNVGVSQAQTEYAIFLDDDCLPDNGLVEAYSAIFKELDPKIAVVAGRVIEEGSNIFHEREDLVGGYVTKYGKTLKNFDTETAGLCEWAPGGNFAVRTSVYREVGGFDLNYIGTAVMEDSDFGYSVSRLGYKVLYDPRPSMVHLRIPSGGLRQQNPARALEYRAHNSVYFFRKHGLKKFLGFVVLYNLAVAIKEWLKGNYSVLGIYFSFSGFLLGLKTELVETDDAKGNINI